MVPTHTGFWASLKRFLLWDYHRGSWQYDVMVGLILAFIFLTPRDFFRDYPKPKTVTQIAAEHGGGVSFLVEPDLLSRLPEKDQRAAAEKLIRAQPGAKSHTVVRVQANYDSEHELLGYTVHTKP